MPKQLKDNVYLIITRFGRLREVADTVAGIFGKPIPDTAYLFIDEGMTLARRAAFIAEIKKHKPPKTQLEIKPTSYPRLQMLIGYYLWIPPEYKRREKRNTHELDIRTPTL